MAWLIFDANVWVAQSASTFWHIIAGRSVVVPERREMALHGELLLEGELTLKNEARLRLET